MESYVMDINQNIRIPVYLSPGQLAHGVQAFLGTK